MQVRVFERKEDDKRRAFYRSLHSSGLVKRIKPRPTIDSPRRTLIQAQGPPVSQTIISAFGSAPDEALREVQIAKQAWVEAAMASGKPIPEPRYRPVIYQLAA